MSTLYIVGDINEDLFVNFAKKFQDCEDEQVTIIINSQGGEEHVGRAIAGLIKSSGKTVHTIGFGAIYSSAVIIFAAGATRKLSKAAVCMLHESSDRARGTSTQIKKFAKEMERSEEFWCSLLQDYTGTDARTWMKLHSDETFLQPQEALKLNLATELV